MKGEELSVSSGVLVGWRGGRDRHKGQRTRVKLSPEPSSIACAERS